MFQGIQDCPWQGGSSMPVVRSKAGASTPVSALRRRPRSRIPRPGCRGPRHEVNPATLGLAIVLQRLRAGRPASLRPWTPRIGISVAVFVLPDAIARQSSHFSREDWLRPPQRSQRIASIAVSSSEIFSAKTESMMFARRSSADRASTNAAWRSPPCRPRSIPLFSQRARQCRRSGWSAAQSKTS